MKKLCIIIWSGLLLLAGCGTVSSRITGESVEGDVDGAGEIITDECKFKIEPNETAEIIVEAGPAAGEIHFTIADKKGNPVHSVSSTTDFSDVWQITQPGDYTLTIVREYYTGQYKYQYDIH